MEMAALTHLSVEDIRRGLKSLPQELYDEIYRFTFTKPSGPLDLRNAAKVRSDLKLLHISSEIRELYASAYYSRRVIFRVDNKTGGNRFRLWLKSLPSKHRALLPELRFKASTSFSVDTGLICTTASGQDRYFFRWIKAIRTVLATEFGATLTSRSSLKVKGKVYR